MTALPLVVVGSIFERQWQCPGTRMASFHRSRQTKVED
jgi:hypothetical protein